MAVTYHLDGRRRRARESKLFASQSIEGDPTALLRALQEAAAPRDLAASTRGSYNQQWRSFAEWCSVHNARPLGADAATVAAYLEEAAALASDDGRFVYAAGTLGCWLTAINHRHLEAGWPKPSSYAEVREVMDWVRYGRSRYGGRTAPMMLADLKEILGAIDVSSWPAGLAGQRDRTLLLIGFASAYQRATLAEVQLRNARLLDDGLLLWSQDFGAGPEGDFTVKFLPTGSNILTCSSCSFARWVRLLAAARESQAAVSRVLDAADFTSHVCSALLSEQSGLAGPMFPAIGKGGRVTRKALSAAAVNDIVKNRAADAGFASSGFSARSLRSGFLTEAYQAGMSNQDIMVWTGQRSFNAVASYSREMGPMVRSGVHRLDL